MSGWSAANGPGTTSPFKTLYYSGSTDQFAHVWGFLLLVDLMISVLESGLVASMAW